MAKRVPHIDGLRAVAVLAVVAEHASSYALKADSAAGQVFRSGMHGVDLFFVISGFCLSYPTLARMHESGFAGFDVAKFAAHRVVRIIPPYYVAIALMIVFALARGLPISWSDVTKQFLFLDGAGASHMLNPSFWTLPIEFRWYALFPILLWLWTKSPRAFGAVAIVAACSTATRFWSQDILILPAFMLGIVAAHVYVRGHRYARFALPLAAGFAVLGALRTPANWDNAIHPAWQAAAFFFVVAAGSSGWLKGLLSSRPLAGIGVASYSIYLVHDPLIDYLVRRGDNLIVAAMAGVAAGIVFWYFVERHFTDRSPVRTHLVARFNEFAPRWLAFAGIPRDLRLTSERRKATAIIQTTLAS